MRLRTIGALLVLTFVASSAEAGILRRSTSPYKKYQDVKWGSEAKKVMKMQRTPAMHPYVRTL